jgi:hypothetical protein
MAEDEGRFGLRSEPRRGWAPPPLRPGVIRSVVRESLYVFAAVCPQLGRLTALILPQANSQMMTLFLAQVARDFADYFIIMLVDRAGWQVSKALRCPDNIRLLPQPAGSPALNPTEHLWDDMREKDLANQRCASLDHLEDRLCASINRLAIAPAYVRSLTNFPYMRSSL